jgi:hypothetical protein
MYDLAEFAMRLSPEQRQAAMSELLRRRSQSGALQEANSMAHSMDVPAAAAAMSNNPALSAAAGMMTKSLQAQHKPVQMGQQGFALPSSGEFVSSPMYESEQEAGRQARAELSREQQQSILQRTREAQAAALERQRERDENNRTLRLAIAAMRGAGGSDSGSGSGGPKVKNLPAGTVEKLTTKQTLAMDFADLLPAFKDKYGGAGFDTVGKLSNVIGKNQPLGMGEDLADQSNWWQNYNDKKNIIRNQLFGSALTKPEQEAFDAANITEGMSSKEIRRRLSQQSKAAARAYNKLKQNYGNAGYDVSNFEDAADTEAPAPGGRDTGGKGRSAPPAGVSAREWEFMSPEDQALWK